MRAHTEQREVGLGTARDSSFRLLPPPLVLFSSTKQNKSKCSIRHHCATPREAFSREERSLPSFCLGALNSAKHTFPRFTLLAGKDLLLRRLRGECDVHGRTEPRKGLTVC